MPWCPNCKLEYVDGVKVCPDCKTALTDTLEDDFEIDDAYAFDEEQMESVMPLVSDVSDEEKLEILSRIKSITETPQYKSKADRYVEHKSGAGVLVVCGILGGIVLMLNALGVINIPFRGFSLILVYAVMGVLFFVFFVSGILSIVKMKQLKPEVEKEKELIDSAVDFIRGKKAEGAYEIDKDNYEASYLELCEKVVSDIEANFLDLEPGFAFFIVDRFAGDILDED